MSEPTSEQVKALADAMWQVLDDMGLEGKGVCGATKAQARVAFEPFVAFVEAEETLDLLMPVAEAKAILIEVGLL